MTRARFLVVNVMLAAIAIAYWRLGVFDQMTAAHRELVFIVTLVAFGCAGLVDVLRQDWDGVSFYAHTAPVLALPMTGYGMYKAFLAMIDGMAPIQILQIGVGAILPNVVGGAILFYFMFVAWQSARERV